MTPAPEAIIATPVIVYTTALFSESHVDSLSHLGIDDESEASEEIPRLVLDVDGIETGSPDML